MRAASAAEEDAAVAVADVVPLLLATFVAELAEASAALKVVPATEELEALAVVPEASEVLQATAVVLPTVEALPATAEALQHMAAVPQVADSEEVEATAIHLAPADQVVPLGGRDASHLTLDTDRPDLPFHPSLHITHHTSPGPFHGSLYGHAFNFFFTFHQLRFVSAFDNPDSCAYPIGT